MVMCGKKKRAQMMIGKGIVLIEMSINSLKYCYDYCRTSIIMYHIYI